MAWSSLFVIDAPEKIFVLGAVLLGFFAGVFLTLGVIELIHTLLGIMVGYFVRSVRIRFLLRIVVFWAARLAEMGVAFFAAAAVAYADTSGAGGYVQVNIFIFIGLVAAWRTLAVWPEFARHVHCLSEFSQIQRASFQRHDGEKEREREDELWVLTDANEHYITYHVATKKRGQRVSPVTKELIPIGLFTSSRYTVSLPKKIQ